MRSGFSGIYGRIRKKESLIVIRTRRLRKRAPYFARQNLVFGEEHTVFAAGRRTYSGLLFFVGGGASSCVAVQLGGRTFFAGAI